MKKFIAVLLSACVIAASAIAFTACGDGNALRVATNAAFPPFEYKQGNAFTGIDIQIAKELADSMDRKLEVVDMDFDAVVTSVSTGDCDIGMAGLTVTEDRKQVVDFTDAYYTSAQVIIYKNGNSAFTGLNSKEAIENFLKAQNKDFVIGTQNGTTGFMYSNGDEGMGYDGFTNLTTKGYTSGALAVRDLVNGKVNAVIIDKQPALMIAAAQGGVTVIDDVELTSESYAFCVKKGDAEMLKAANDLLDTLQENGKLDDIINSFFDGTADFTYTN